MGPASMTGSKYIFFYSSEAESELGGAKIKLRIKLS